MNPTQSFRTVRWVRTINLVLQIVLFTSLFGGLNYVAQQYHWRFDLTESHRYSLSPETRAYLARLAAPVSIYVTLADDDANEEVVQARRDVMSLLREYQEAARAGSARITVETVDVYQERRKAESLKINQANIILVQSGDESRVVGLNELYAVEDREKKGFLGEQAFTSAILDVTNPDKKKVYFLKGHGEMSFDDVDPVRGLSLLKGELQSRNIAIDTLDLTATHKIPEDAALLVVAGPQGRLEPFEEELLRRYLTNQAGRVILMLSPGYPHGLEDLLYDWGILVDDVVVLDRGTNGQNDFGDLILYPTTEDHPIIRFLSSNGIAVRFGLSRTARPDMGRAIDSGLVVTPLLATSETAWGERSYRQNGTPAFNAGVDVPGRLVLASASERVSTRDNLPFSVRGGRIVVFGGSEWAANGRLASGGNLSLVLSSFNWLIDRDVQLNIAPRPIERFQLTLTSSQFGRLRFSILFILPGVAALLGLVVYWVRRH